MKTRAVAANAPFIAQGAAKGLSQRNAAILDRVVCIHLQIAYAHGFGKFRDNGTAVTTQNGFTTLLKDRGFVSLTFKTTF